jgi:hypothetical protein
MPVRGLLEDHAWAMNVSATAAPIAILPPLLVPAQHVNVLGCVRGVSSRCSSQKCHCIVCMPCVKLGNRSHSLQIVFERAIC